MVLPDGAEPQRYDLFGFRREALHFEKERASARRSGFPGVGFLSRPLPRRHVPKYSLGSDDLSAGVMDGNFDDFHDEPRALEREVLFGLPKRLSGFEDARVIFNVFL